MNALAVKKYDGGTTKNQDAPVQEGNCVRKFGRSNHQCQSAAQPNILAMPRADPIASTSIIKKNADTPDYIVRVTNITPARLNILGTADGKRSLAIAPKLPHDCEALASSLSDPILGHIAGRCFV